MQSFVSKNRKPRFDLHLTIVDLNNVPLVSGTCLIKWHLPSSSAAEHRGRTEKRHIKDHKVDFNYAKDIPVRMIISKDQMLQDSWIHFEVLQEYSSAGKGQRIMLGSVKLNLAEYVEASENVKEEEGVVRRYLMQDSKINSTLKIGIRLTHVEGPKDYYAPPLRTAPVFGGIAGIISSDAAGHSPVDPSSSAAHDDHMLSLSSKSREAGELQDMYRRTLAASWSAQPGELKADDCIEDIFAGGDGWGSHVNRKNGKRDRGLSAGWTAGGNNGDEDAGDGFDDDMASVVSDDSRTDAAPRKGRAGRTRSQSPNSHAGFLGHMHTRSKETKRDLFAWPHPHHMSHNAHDAHSAHNTPSPHSPHSKTQNGHRHGSARHGSHTGGIGRFGGGGGRSSIHQQARRVDLENARREGRAGRILEVDEFENPWREDLRAWNVNTQALPGY